MLKASMDMQLLQEILVGRAEMYRLGGAPAAEALRLAQGEMIAAARKRVAGARLFCFRACLLRASGAVSAGGPLDAGA